MDYRSTNARFVHYGGDITSHIQSSHGVQLSGGSTGGIVQAVGDDANISLNILGKGTGSIVLGNSSQSVFVGTSTRALKGAFSQNSTWSNAAITGGHGQEITFASTTVDINPGDLLSVGLTVATADASSQVGIASWRLSTVATSRVTVVLNAFGSTATSSLSGTFHFSWLDLT